MPRSAYFAMRGHPPKPHSTIALCHANNIPIEEKFLICLTRFVAEEHLCRTMDRIAPIETQGRNSIASVEKEIGPIKNRFYCLSWNLRRLRFIWTVGATICLIMMLLPPIAYAQFNSTVEGTVSDATGAVVAGAKVTLHNLKTGVDSTANTNTSGLYRFSYVAPGDYQVSVESAGFTKQVVNTTVTTNQTYGVNLTLSPAATATTVLVTGEAPALNPDETRIQATLETKDIEKLPLQNGSIFETLRVAPGVVGIDEDRVNWAINIGGASPIASANGRTADANLCLLDGASIQSNSHGGGNTILPTVNITPNADMIGEVSLETSTFSVENGAGSSMRVNFTTNSGTNDWHGDVGFRYTSRGLVATPDFTSSNSPFARKWWTGSLGGPVRKNQTFFFFSYEHQSQITALSSLVSDFTPQFAQWAQANFPNSYNVINLMIPFPPDQLIPDPSQYVTFADAEGLATKTGTCPWAGVGEAPRNRKMTTDF